MTAAASAQALTSVRPRAVARFVGSPWFLGAVLLAFAAQSVWVAFLTSYSVYDEQYHIAAIAIFAEGWSPFVDDQPSRTIVGDVERYPSFLYHYLMSFPWRWTRALAPEWSVTVLRVLSALMVTAGLAVWRSVLRQLGAGPAVANAAVLAVSLVPLLVFLAGTVNYDNLLFLLTAAFVLAAVRLYRSDSVDVLLWLQLVSFASLAAITKYTFLPFGAVLLIFVVVRQVATIRSRGLGDSLSGWRATTPVRRVLRWLWVTLAAVALTLFLHRYVGNVLSFGTPFPDCADVQPESTCLQWGPWARNRALDAGHVDTPFGARVGVGYLFDQWLPHMQWQATAIGVVDGEGQRRWSNGPHVAGVVLAWAVPMVAAVLALSIPTLRRLRGALPALASCGVYVAVLFTQNLVDYLRLGQTVGVQARYLLPVLPIVVGLAFVGSSRLLGTAYRWKVFLFCGLLVVSTQGGGLMQFLHQTDQGWWAARPPLIAVQERLSALSQRLVLPDDLVRDARVDP